MKDLVDLAGSFVLPCASCEASKEWRLMSRILWIAGLIFALCVFAGLLLFCVIALITHHHLNSRGWLMLLGDGFAVSVIFRYLRETIGEGKSLPPIVPLD